ncbi:MAG: hypothetical protein J6X94_08235 [Lachnospiraceae bacterium]|nr:hypothetical protein [Lachnospiraceae bacterium]
MEDNKSIFDYISKVFTVFGVVILIHVIIGSAVGNDASEMSTLFSLGAKGLAMSTILQLFVLSVIVIILQTLFLTDRVIKSMSIAIRIILMFVSVTCAIVIFVLAFKWFPVYDAMAWVGFFVSFAICSLAGVCFSRLKEKAENKKMDEALKKYKG